MTDGYISYYEGFPFFPRCSGNVFDRGVADIMWVASTRELPKRSFESRVKRFPNAVVVWPPDEIDLATIAALRGSLIRAGEENASIIIEMSQVSYIASVGVQELLTWAGRCAERKLRLVVAAPSKFIVKVLGIVDSDGLIPLVPSLDAALDLFRP